jgi:membrane fusion protein (multidrug efflux system)
MPVRTALPSVEEVADRVSLPAELLPYRRAVLASEVGGVIDSLSFDVGQRVGSGRVLVAIDTRSLEQAVAEAAAVDRQRRLQFERAERLFAKRSITQQQMLDAATNRDVAAARLASAQLQLSKSQVRAPWRGSIARRWVEVGDFVTPGQPIAELVEVRRLKVRAPASAKDVPWLSVGTEVEVRVDALSGDPILGRIVRLAPEVDPQARTLDIEAEIGNADGRLRPGMPARLELSRRTLVDALLVPLSAVVDLGEADGLFVVEGDRVREQVVELGPVVGERVVIAAGLRAEDRVVTDGARQLVPGQLISEVAETSNGTGE